MSKYPNFLSPLTVGDLTFSNRVFLAPMTRARGINQVANPIIAEYYTQRASSGLIFSEGTHVSPQGVGWCQVPGIWSPEQVEAWKQVTASVHAANGKIFAQLWHQGRSSHSDFHNGKLPVSASAIKIEDEKGIPTPLGRKPYEVPHALTVEEIAQVVEDFRKAAVNAKEAGFDGVEVHGANGYLVDQFLQAKTNKREDQYGGSIENRTRFLLEIVDAILTVLPKERISVRIAPNGVFGDMGTPEFRELFLHVATELGKRQIGFLHMMDGLGFGFHKLGEPLTLKDVRAVLPKETRLIGNCGYTFEQAEAAIAAGDADAISIGRPYLANPDLVERLTNDWPLNELAPYDTWYSPNETYSTGKGFTDYPKYTKPE